MHGRMRALKRVVKVLQSMVASKAAKLMTACICPVVGSAALTLSVPKVRDAVHKATAPRQYAKPKTRVRQPVASAAPAAVAPCPTAVPVVLSSLELPIGPANPLTPLQFADNTPSGPPGFVPPPPGPRPIGPGIVTPPPPVVPVLPDAQTWIQMILGFGFIGGAIRVSQARRRRQLVPASITVSFGGIAPESERPFA